VFNLLLVIEIVMPICPTVSSWFVRWLLLIGLTCVQLGCGGGTAPKTDDPNKVEEQRKEHLDISHKERSG